MGDRMLEVVREVLRNVDHWKDRRRCDPGPREGRETRPGMVVELSYVSVMV